MSKTNPCAMCKGLGMVPAQCPCDAEGDVVCAVLHTKPCPKCFTRPAPPAPSEAVREALAKADEWTKGFQGVEGDKTVYMVLAAEVRRLSAPKSGCATCAKFGEPVLSACPTCLKDPLPAPKSSEHLAQVRAAWEKFKDLRDTPRERDMDSLLAATTNSDVLPYDPCGVLFTTSCRKPIGHKEDAHAWCLHGRAPKSEEACTWPNTPHMGHTCEHDEASLEAVRKALQWGHDLIARCVADEDSNIDAFDSEQFLNEARAILAALSPAPRQEGA